MIIPIAWRNLWRHKLRSAVVMVAVFVGMFAGIFSTALMFGMVEGRVNSAIGNETSNIQIHNKEFIAENEYSFTIKNSAEIFEFLGKFEEVKSYSPRLLASGMITSPSTASGVAIVGVDPQKEMAVTNLFERVIEGEYLPEGARNPIYISERLAENLAVSLRGRIVLSFQDPQGNITAGAFRVAGIFRTENSSFDMTNVFVRKSDLIKISSYTANQIHEIAVRLHDDSKNDFIVSQINEAFNDAGVMARGWATIQPALGMMIESMSSITFIMIAIILFALGFTIINTMLMAVMERYHEFGVLMAVGMKKTKIFAMVMLESLFLSLTGAVIGMIASYGAIFYAGKNGIDISSVAEGMQAMGYSAVIYPSIEFSFYVIVTILVMLTALLAAIYPALKALKLNPAEAVRSE